MSSACFILFEDKKVLMERRKEKDTFFPNAWLFPGGKVDSGEEPWEAAYREMKEELGIRPINWYPLWTGGRKIYSRLDLDHHVIPHVVLKWRGVLPDRILDTGNELKWFHLDTVIDLALDYVSEIAGWVEFSTRNKVHG